VTVKALEAAKTTWIHDKIKVGQKAEDCRRRPKPRSGARTGSGCAARACRRTGHNARAGGTSN
jgi:hypothetical protein